MLAYYAWMPMGFQSSLDPTKLYAKVNNNGSLYIFSLERVKFSKKAQNWKSINNDLLEVIQDLWTLKKKRTLISWLFMAPVCNILDLVHLRVTENPK